VAEAPWRCTQCGTVNEPNANACRSCGRWPSLFDLEQGAVDTEPDYTDDELEETFGRDAPAPVEAQHGPVDVALPVETQQDDSGVPEKPAEWPGPENPLDRPTQGWPRVASWIVPIAFVVYIVISMILNR
jgi:hypothetical protein